MAAATQNISIRIAVLGAGEARREITLTGDLAERVARRVNDSFTPASKSMLALNVVGEQVRFQMEGLAGGAGTLATSLIRLGPIGLAAAAVIGSLSIATAAGIREFKEAEQALNTLNAALKATDSQSGVTAREITALGERIQENTLFKKGEVQRAAAALTSFQNVAGDTFLRAIRLSTDLATRLGTDLPSAADMLGKALEQPEEGLGRLGRRFTDLLPAQKEAIANFVKQGDVASAQAVILDHLEGKTRGLAEAQTKGLTGAADSLSDAWGDLMESLGRTVSESGAAQTSLAALTRVVRGLQEALDDSPQSRKTALEKEIADLEDSFGVRVDRFVLGSAPGLDAKKRELKKINDGLAEEQRKAEEEKNAALKSADEAAADQRNAALLQIEKEFQKKFKEATQTERDKILAEAADAKKRIEAYFKDTRNSGSAERALAAVDENTRAQLKKLGQQDVNRAEDARARAIQKINDELLRTKPSFDLAKQALDNWKDGLIKDLGGATEENEKYIALIEQIYTVKLKDIYNKSLLDSKNWADGATRALRRYADEATNASKNAEEVFGNAAKRIEDTLVDMVSTGEFSMKKLGDLILSIEQDILRSFIRQNITGPIAGALGDILGGGGSSGGGSSGGGFFSGLFNTIGSWFHHEGGIVGSGTAPRRMMPAYLFAGAPRLHSGLMPDEFPAILQRGETVLPKNSKMGGNNIVFNISTPNAQSFMDSQGQIMNRLAVQLGRHKARNG